MGAGSTLKHRQRAGRFSSLADKTHGHSHNHDTDDLCFKVGETLDSETLERFVVFLADEQNIDADRNQIADRPDKKHVDGLNDGERQLLGGSRGILTLLQ